LHVTFRPSSPVLSVNNKSSDSYSYEELIAGTPVIIGCDNDDMGTKNPVALEVFDHTNKMIGKLTVLSGRPHTKQLKFVYVRLKHQKNFPTFDTDEALRFLNMNSHNQVFVNWETIPSENFVFDIHEDNVLGMQYSEGWVNPGSAKSRIYTSYERNVKKAMGLIDQFNYVFIVDVRAKIHDEQGQLGDVGGINDLGANVCVLFIGRNNGVLAHELGHSLSLLHTFSDKLDKKTIRKFGTNNIMDYSNERNSFFVYQIKQVLDFLNKE
jgi:hypothetical protein